MASIRERIRDSWNVFTGKALVNRNDLGPGSWYGSSFNRRRLTRNNTQSIVSTIYNRIAVDCAAITIVHSRIDENGKYAETIDDDLNKTLNIEANLDQTGRDFIQDVVTSMMDEGKVAIVPIETSGNPTSDSYDIYSLRTGKITQWYPQHVRVEVYNDRTGRHEQLLLPKRYVAIVENPFYSIMNEPNSTLQRLIRKINLLDYIDEQAGSNRLDMILQLPYSLKTEARKKEAEKRLKEIEKQLSESKYGMAYVDSTEKITQLNRSIENNLWNQIKDLTSTLYSQLGLTEAVFTGTADEAAMLNYYNRTIEPILSAITNEMKRKFLTPTARSQGQSFSLFRDPFKLVPTDKIADIADKFTRSQILSPNELRAIVGYKPVDDPRADELRNPNLNEPAGEDTEPPINTGDEYMYPDETLDSDRGWE